MKEICKYCEKIKPDVIFTEMIRTSQYIDFFKRFDAINISNLDDLLSKRYERQALSIKRVTNIAGIYSSKLPKLLDRLIKNVNFKKSILKFESKRCDIWEKKFYKEFDYIMFTSPLETNEMNVKMCDQKAITLSVGVDYDLFAKPLVSVEKEKNSMSYVGNFRVASNCDTLRMICNEILPKVQHEYKFYVVGLCPDEIRNTYKNNSRIIFCGRVENLVEIVQKTEVFFSPILYGTGIKTKIIEAMAMGMPVITNDVGVEGINAKDGIHLIIENEYDNLVKSLVVLLDDSKLRNKIGLNAQSFVNEFFRWDVIYNAFNLIGL